MLINMRLCCRILLLTPDFSPVWTVCKDDEPF